MNEPGWIIHYREIRSGRQVKSEATDSRQSALDFACIRLHDGDEVHFIQGPRGAIIGRREIEVYCGQRPAEGRG